MLSVPLVSATAPHARPLERFDGCKLNPDKWTDGDSFRVRLPDGRLETFRLYYLDTTESRSRGKRSDEQAAFFRADSAMRYRPGYNQLKHSPRLRSHNPSQSGRNSAIVWTNAVLSVSCSPRRAKNLAELLVRDGRARSMARARQAPDGRNSRQSQTELKALYN